MTKKTPQARVTPADRLSAIASVVAFDADFQGDFHSASDQGIKIDGSLKGNVTFDKGGVIHIGPSGVVDGSRLEADYIFIEGKFSGTMVARQVIEISGSATVVGDAVYDDLIDVHPRARIRGKIEYRGDMDANRPE